MKNEIEYLIIGAGPTGLGAAYRLKELGIQDYIILEKESYPGGLATSFTDPQGFTWDIGGHVQFSHYPYFDKVMQQCFDKDGWYNHQRESWVWLKNRFIPYPFQNNIHRLDLDDRECCLDGLQNRSDKDCDHFKDWLNSSFGDGLCNLFLYPYNFKVWAYPPETMNYSWIGERVATVDLKRIKKNIQNNQDDVSWGPNNTFQFPKHGGTGAIWDSVAKKVSPEKIILNSPVALINPKDKVVTLEDGQEVIYKNLLNTSPLDLMSQKVTSLSQNAKKEALKLKYSSSHIIGIGIEGQPPKELEGKCWMYFPENDCPFYRVTVFSHYSPYNVPNIKTQYSLMAEVSESSYKQVDSEKILEETIQGFYNTKLIQPSSKIITKWYLKAGHGYPTPSLKRDDILRTVQSEWEENEIYSRGRFGGWKYEVSNQDHSFMQGVEWTDFIVNSQEEKTYQWS
jgi:protoporphyrinogen oxidase